MGEKHHRNGQKPPNKQSKQTQQMNKQVVFLFVEKHPKIARRKNIQKNQKTSLPKHPKSSKIIQIKLYRFRWSSFKHLKIYKQIILKKKKKKKTTTGGFGLFSIRRHLTRWPSTCVEVCLLVLVCGVIFSLTFLTFLFFSFFSFFSFPLFLECGAECDLKLKDPVVCRNCGHRILYKKRTKRSLFLFLFFVFVCFCFCSLFLFVFVFVCFCCLFVICFCYLFLCLCFAVEELPLEPSFPFPLFFFFFFFFFFFSFPLSFLVPFSIYNFLSFCFPFSHFHLQLYNSKPDKETDEPSNCSSFAPNFKNSTIAKTCLR